jgi:6-phosphogluconolactonase
MLGKSEKREIMVPGNEVVTLAFCVQHWIKSAQSAIRDHGSFFVALSGGSTPKAIYERLAGLPDQLDWSKVFFFWSDERAVSPDNPDSNYHMAMEAGLKELSIPSSHIFRMPAEKEIEAGAKEYEKMIQKVLGKRPFDLIMLGMGEDGHTASLFPHTEGLHVKDRQVIANFIPQKKCWRMTMTFSCINSAKQAAIYVLGPSKKEMVKEVLLSKEEPERFPVQAVGTKERPALWILDESAASLLE